MRAFLERHDALPDSTNRLAGDASARRYHRVERREGGSAVVMQCPSPFPAESADACEPFAFLRWQGFYRGLGIRVPDIIAIDRGAGLALLEDLGDELLQHRVESQGLSRCEDHYFLAVEWALRLAHAGTEEFTPDPQDSDDPLTPARLGIEMNFFLQHSLALPARALGESATTELRHAQELLHGLCEDVHVQGAGVDGMVLCHRDYHARNLLVPGSSRGETPPLAVIDFQDTRRGPRAYDLASLAWDPYVDLPDSLTHRLVEAWRPAGVATDDWQQEVALAAGQRLIKAAGSYAWLGLTQGREEYLQWYAPALERAFAQLRCWPRGDELEEALRAIGVEW